MNLCHVFHIVFDITKSIMKYTTCAYVRPQKNQDLFVRDGRKRDITFIKPVTSTSTSSQCWFCGRDNRETQGASLCSVLTVLSSVFSTLQFSSIPRVYPRSTWRRQNVFRFEYGGMRGKRNYISNCTVLRCICSIALPRSESHQF